MSNFSKNWRKKEPGISRRIGGIFSSPQPIKPQIDRAVREINALLSRLNQSETRIRARDDSIFGRVVSALQKSDREHASIYANELSEVRRMGRMVTGAKLALEQVVLRLTTITDLGDVAAMLAPTITVVKGVGQEVGSLLPNVEGEIDEISSLLSSTLVEAGSVGGVSLNFKAANEEAERVLEEASTVAAQRMAESFPAVPLEVQQDDQEEGLAV